MGRSELRIGGGRPCAVICGNDEPEAVKIAAKNLMQDLKRVFGDKVTVSMQGFKERESGCCRPERKAAEGIGREEGLENAGGGSREESLEAAEIWIHTLTGNADGDGRENVLSPAGRQAGKVSPGSDNPGAGLWDADGKPRKEAYSLQVRDGSLYITGTDRRGTIYGIYTFSEMLGVSPWYFWADVPVKQKDTFTLKGDFEKSDYPSVEYRGIFINDEEELEAWVKNRMGEETIGVKTYEKVFELLLRLKGNYIWPAMHVNSFNARRENGALAERMGIVVGTSHCDMLMRSNNREWFPWLAKKGYEGVEYDYSLPGRNREILREYWRESVEQNREFEVCYTLGMRGIHDSGFETRALQGLSGEEEKTAKIALLQKIMEDQQEILKGVLGRAPLMTFVPYKEVLPLYDGGLKVPEDITLVWSNDNYGYIRRYPSEEEKRREGGNGIYYHNSYWAPPGMSYVFLCSIPLAHTANELRKAYGEGVRKLWVINTGAMKPLEQEIEFFLRLAWEIGKEGALTEDVDAYAEDWINRNFSGGIGKETAGILNDFSQLTNVRKLEMMDQNAFSQTAYGDEAVTRIHTYERLFEAGNRLYEGLPREERPAFFELVLMRIHAAYFTNLAYYYGDRSTLTNRQGKTKAAALYAGRTRLFEDARRRLLVYYNKRMLEGKWDGILNPEGFPPPRAAMMPICTPPLRLAEGAPKLCVTLWNEAAELTFTRPGTKWLEIGNAGGGSVDFVLEAPEWAELSERAGSTETECRVLVTVRQEEERRGSIRVIERNTGETLVIPVGKLAVKESGEIPCEEDGVLFVRADAAVFLPEGFKRVKRLGRGGGDLVEVCGEGKDIGEPLSYKMYFVSSGEFLLELHRFPSLDSVGRIRIGVSVDGGRPSILESESRDERLGSWRDNVRNNVDRLYLRLPYLEAGIHTVSFYAVDKYFAFSGFAVYTAERRENNLVGAAFTGEQALPGEFDAEEFADSFYGRIELHPRPVEYARPSGEYDTLTAADWIAQEESFAENVAPGYYLELGTAPFTEENGAVKIDAAAALANHPCAFAEGDMWAYCGSESYGRSGLAMYIPADGERGDCEPECPSLSYRVNCSGGLYTIWLLAKFDKKEEAYFGVGVDGEVLPGETLYNGGCLWRYEAEQIYRWVPVAKRTLSEGEHRISLYAPAAGLRFDRLYLTRGSELPPMDSVWSRSLGS